MNVVRAERVSVNWSRVRVGLGFTREILQYVPGDFTDRYGAFPLLLF